MRDLRTVGAADSRNEGELGTRLRGTGAAIDLWRESSLTGNHPSFRDETVGTPTNDIPRRGGQRGEGSAAVGVDLRREYGEQT